MAVSVIKQTGDSIILQISVNFNRSMLDSEETIQDELNVAGTIATEALLKSFDTDGSPLIFGSVKMTSQGLVSKHYQTPYGEATVARHLYQTSAGGATFCPLERDARIIIASTPRFASQISYKMSDMPASAVVNDFSANHHRQIARNVIQRVSDAVSAIVQVKEETWSYQAPEIVDKEITTVSIGLDGTCMLLCEGSYRQAMVGTIALYDHKGERQHTTYIAAAPEHGKEKFTQRLTREIARTRELYPNAEYIGVADGAHDNWSFLKAHTNKQVLDFYHASEYITKVADSVFKDLKERDKWLTQSCHELKNTIGAAAKLLEEFKVFESKLESQDNKTKKRELTESKDLKKKVTPLESAITYFQNNINESRMNYAETVAANQPIGSGVTEAACKTIVKQRLCESGMRWKEKGAASILSLRALVKSTGRWDQFWSKVNQYGFPIAA